MSRYTDYRQFSRELRFISGWLTQGGQLDGQRRSLEILGSDSLIHQGQQAMSYTKEGRPELPFKMIFVQLTFVSSNISVKTNTGHISYKKALQKYMQHRQRPHSKVSHINDNIMGRPTFLRAAMRGSKALVRSSWLFCLSDGGRNCVISISIWTCSRAGRRSMVGSWPSC